jgi:DNA-binding MarR family transcriptional regulator
MSSPIEDDILRSLRRITRAIDLHSRQLMATFGLTGPQLVCLRAIGREPKLTPSELARSVSLSQATVTGIVDRLVARQLVTRTPTPKDRRSVYVSLTQAGLDLVAYAPSPLQERFSLRLASLSDSDRESLRAALERVVQLMDGTEIDAAPVLDINAELAPGFVEDSESPLPLDVSVEKDSEG